MFVETSEIRQNKATRQWVIYSPARRKRPQDFRETAERKEPLPEVDRTCPFCPGNGHMLPPVIAEMKDEKGRWQVRVVPNKFPALVPSGTLERRSSGIYVAMQGYGHHEVIIESPRHNYRYSRMTIPDARMVIETYHARYLDLMKEDDNMMVLIFRNHGKGAGTSLIHPHSQLIATGIVPNHIRWRETEAQRYFDEWGRCVYCDIVAYEGREARRMVYENEFFLSFVPYAAEVPFEVWIIPKNHKADFGDISDAEKDALADAMGTVLDRLYGSLGDPDYNYIINTSARYRAREPQLHWYLQIRPRLMTMAGFEIGTGISINPSVPEEDADLLRR
jgi:UDPglucose--hexose-1-phosphate uridylyltransferase